MHHHHDFDWENVEVLNVERNLNKIISEILHIKRQNNGLNLQNGYRFAKSNIYTIYLQYINNDYASIYIISLTLSLTLRAMTLRIISF